MLGCSHKCGGQLHSWRADDGGVWRLKCDKGKTQVGGKVEVDVAQGIKQKHAYVAQPPAGRAVRQCGSPWWSRLWCAQVLGH